MRRTIFGSAIAAVWYAGLAFAQQPAAPPKGAPAHNVFVVTGCLEAGKDPTASFKLTDASSTGQAAPVATAEAGAVGTSGLKASYELRPVSGLNAQGLNAEALKAHVGQRLEVVVRPIDSPAAAAPDAGAVRVEAAKPVEPAPQRFSVTEVKRVIGGCS